MNKAAVILVPAAFFAAWLWIIVVSIEPMVSRENNNKFHAMLLGCKNLGNSKDIEHVLYFDCNGKIELHKELDWSASIKK